jgi:glycosyltransferase involved in cell wall biosynthesis
VIAAPRYQDEGMKQDDYLLTVLLPTSGRSCSVAMTLASLTSQDYPYFQVVIAEQNAVSVGRLKTVKAAMRLLEHQGRPVTLYQNMPKQGLGQQRQFLLEQATSAFVVYIDDDLILEPWVLTHLMETILREGCGLVGSAPIGLSYYRDIRPEEQAIEFWETPVVPEVIRPGGALWQRHKLHNAANLYHVANTFALTPETYRSYKIAWVGGCVLYDRQKLLASGGFSFWNKLPATHVGEDVYAELQVIKRFGGCGLIPSGVYHLELATTVSERKVDAPYTLPF